MKNIYKLSFIVFLSVFTLFLSCETVELEKLQDPNALSPDQADPTLLFNSVQLNYKNTVAIFNNLGGQLSRIDYMSGRVYYENYPGSTLNGAWSNLYSGMIPDIANIESLNTEGTYDYILGISKAMEAHILMLFVDYVGDVVYTEANMPDEFPSPSLDDDQAVYQSALSLLNEATSLLNSSTESVQLDLFFDDLNDQDIATEKWIKFINTLRMRVALTTGDYQGVINATNVIETAEDNVVFAYGDNQQNPDNRHPDYASDYTDSGAGLYRSNWLMNLMAGELGDVTGDDDPRRRYYFYRQSAVTPGSITNLLYEGNEQFYIYPDILGLSTEDAQTLTCSVQDTPTHLQFTEEEDYWCSVRLGYWGRVHGNAEGIPPDTFDRTASGVYPAGGRFDDNPDYVFLDTPQENLTFYDASVGLGLGAGGTGIEPIILSSYVEFWRAEAYAMRGNYTMASTHLEAGLEESINYVTSFGALDTAADKIFEPTEERIEDFIANTIENFEDAPNTTALDAQDWPIEKSKLDILGEQFFIAMYGGAADAYNFIRRTGYPRTLARSIDPDPGLFPRTLLYPANEVSANPNVNQRQDNSSQVFWDSGITNPAN